ncbi:hypothetical protein [Metabacillus fastidiosus]|uniref:hypothetical protein n=1 Tax=Metabacillus fastidiosus TaxID=1458 RepID=UPI002DB9799C|nr:hypothetical protein [Metabacillus fastidiosus]MEC2074578.1 hypothetical protein [Metabacillus fastidiosus]
MGTFLGIIGFICFSVFVILAIVGAIRKNGTFKKRIALAGASLVLMIIGAILTPSSDVTTTKEKQKEQTEEVTKKEETKKQVELEKEKAEQLAAKEEEEKKKEKEAAAKEEAEAKKKAEAEKQDIPGTLGIDPNEFKKRFNSAADEFQANFYINDLKINKGEVQDIAQVKLNDNIFLNITVNKADGSIRDVGMIAKGDGTSKSGTDIIFTMGILITSTNPSLTPDERGDVLKDLGLMDQGVDILNIDKETVRNNIKYHLMGSEQIGIMFSAGDAREE